MENELRNRGDCISCPYKTNTTSGICSTFTIYGWCRQTMGENPPDIMPVKWVSAEPTSDYPIRILKAYLDYSVVKTEPPELGDFMNELQHSRNLLLEKAIEILSDHIEELRETLKEPFYKGIPVLDFLEEIKEIRYN